MENKVIIRLPGRDDFFTREAYKLLRTNVQFCGADVKTVAVTSASDNEGKTTTTLNLGVSMSELGKRVLIVDADMRKSVVASTYANVKKPVGLSELISGQCEAADAVYNTQIGGLDIVFSGQYPPNPAELLSSKYFEDFLKAARDFYDYVLVDTPPLGMVVDAAVVSAKCDGAIFVIGKNIHSSQAQEVVDMLTKSGCKVLGAVMNNVDKKKKGYYKRYSE